MTIKKHDLYETVAEIRAALDDAAAAGETASQAAQTVLEIINAPPVTEITGAIGTMLNRTIQNGQVIWPALEASVAEMAEQWELEPAALTFLAAAVIFSADEDGELDPKISEILGLDFDEDGPGPRYVPAWGRGL